MSSGLKDNQVLALMGMGREALSKELQQKKRAENNQLKRACLEELQHEASEDAWYNLKLLRTLLGGFYIADTNNDGRLETSELLKTLKNKDEESYQVMRNFVEACDVGKDQKLNLAEFFILGVLRGFRKVEQAGASDS
ncbi:uncharacterized protein Aud_001839 [Aspergillus udagawae]|uniref:SPARC/Testican calcium-binding domain-containing protein n=1 Tax=Aspergillus udagawae TaxID=91492 RepID=A0A8E0V569_9EURO|nr:uncharacterized protein Aud_001839 [Aspergillus udagawae]GIC94510.1 hypothetical protein Aud_001839 [Aspergillus udagawae]